MANLNFKGEVVNALPIQRGNSKSGNEWEKQTFVVKETEETYPKSIAFDVFGHDKIEQFNIKMGDQIEVSANVESKEWQGKYFTSVSAWKVDKLEGTYNHNSNANVNTHTTQSSSQESDDMPF